MDIVTLGAALNGSAEYVNSHFKGGSNIQIVDNPDGTQTINASGEVSAEDTVAREAIVEHVLDKANPHEVTATQLGLGNVNNTSDIDKPVSTAMQTALNAKANTTDVYSKNEVDTALSSKQNVITDLADIRSGATLGSTAVQPVSGKGLSTNDYTTTEKNKLAGIEAQANKTTVDSVLSETSTNPVQNKVVKSALDGKQDVLSTAQLSAINSGITAERLAQDENNILLNTKYGVSNHFKVTLDDIKRRNINGYTWNDNVATHDSTGITFTVNSDMTITVNGTSSSSTVVFSVGMISPSYNGFMFSCSPSEASISTYRSGVNYVGYDTGNGLLLTNTIDRLAQIEILSNQSVSDVVFKPMIIDKAFWDSGIRNYEPYAMNNAELTSEIETNKNNILSIADQTTIYNYYRQTETVSQTGVTINSDGTITVNVNNTSDNWIALDLMDFSKVNIPNGDYYLYGCPPTGSATTYRLDITRSGATAIAEYGEGTLVSKNNSTPLTYMRLVIAPNTNVQNKLFKPMLIPKAVWDSGFTDYQPYAMSNAELTAKEQTNENNISKYVYETVTVNLASQDISWTAYGSVYASSVIGLTQVGTVLSFVLIDWTGIRDTDLTLIPYQSSSAGNGFKMLSSTNTFLQSNSKVVYRVFGIKQST